MYQINSKPNLGKSLLINLVISNLITIVVGTIQSAFGHTPHYLMSLVINNAMAIMFGVGRTFGSEG